MNETLLTVKVAKKTREADATASFELIDAANASLPPFAAGAHIDVHLGDALVRQYSLCNDARETNHYRIAVLRDANSRGGSAAMHEQVHEGRVLQISAPKNHFPLDPAAPRSLLLAGGAAQAADPVRGAQLYASNCALCHGQDGRAVMPGAPSFNRGDALLRPDFTLLALIRAGRNAMPAFQGRMADRDIMDVIAFMRTLH